MSRCWFSIRGTRCTKKINHLGLHKNDREKKWKADTLRILSLGAGVQSTTVLLMSLKGDLPSLDAAIFADTGWEPKAVYSHLENLKRESKDAGVPLLVVSAGNIHQDHVAPAEEHLFIRNPVKHPEWKGLQRTFIPFYVTDEEGKKGITYRTCTKTYKIEPVERQLRTMLGLAPYQRWPEEHRIDQIFGISYDEDHRMKDSLRPAIHNVYPLVDMKMTRDDCHLWMAEQGWTAPRSACIGCPYHRDVEWRTLRDDSPDEWQEAIKFDWTMRRRQELGLLPIEGVPFIHDQRVPLDEADIDADDEKDPSPFGNECEGMCGI